MRARRRVRDTSFCEGEGEEGERAANGGMVDLLSVYSAISSSAEVIVVLRLADSRCAMQWWEIGIGKVGFGQRTLVYRDLATCLGVLLGGAVLLIPASVTRFSSPSN